MPTVPFSAALPREYERLFETCDIRPERMGAGDEVVAKLQTDKARYQNVGETLGISRSLGAAKRNPGCATSLFEGLDCAARHPGHGRGSVGASSRPPAGAASGIPTSWVAGIAKPDWRPL